MRPGFDTKHTMITGSVEERRSQAELGIGLSAGRYLPQAIGADDPVIDLLAAGDVGGGATPSGGVDRAASRRADSTSLGAR